MPRARLNNSLKITYLVGVIGLSLLTISSQRVLAQSSQELPHGNYEGWNESGSMGSITVQSDGIKCQGPAFTYYSAKEGFVRDTCKYWQFTNISQEKSVIKATAVVSKSQSKASSFLLCKERGYMSVGIECTPNGWSDAQ